MMIDPGDEVPESRRARKLRETRARIVEAAMSLFLEKGFAGVTTEEIAEAADVSKRSFFDYFPTKEDVVQGWHDQFGEALIAAIQSRPADEAPILAMERAMVDALDRSSDDRSIALGRLIYSTPALAARAHMKYARLEQRVAEALIARSSNDPGGFKAQLVAVIVVGMFRRGGEELQGSGRVSRAVIEASTLEAFQQLRRALSEIAADV